MNKTTTMLAATALFFTGASAFAQTAATQSPAQAEAQPSAPAPQSSPTFPPVNLKNFTATSPSREEVNSFLKNMWGYDDNRTWSVAAVLATPAPGVSKIVIFVKDKNAEKTSTIVFFTTPDGKHAIADNVIAFGPKPFAETRQTLMEKADGPAHGAASKDLLIVEFADLQCPHCKDFQATMDHIAQDFPQARIVFENYPLTDIHPWALLASETGECVRKSKGDAAFYIYAQSVFDGQAGLTPETGMATLDTAVAKAGADPAKVKACAATPAIRAAVEAQKKLGVDIGIDQTPEIVVNGRVLPASQIPYDLLKTMIVYQGKQDGIEVKVQPSLNNLK